MKLTRLGVGLLVVCVGLGSAVAQEESGVRSETEAESAAQAIQEQRARIRMSRADAVTYVNMQIVDQFTAERNSRKQLKITSSTGH